MEDKMKIELHQITIGELFDKYKDDEEEGVVGYHGLLNLRPKYQREFVYSPEKRDAVIRSIMNDYPINVMYWVKNEDGTYEMLDGQQRAISICKYLNGEFGIDTLFYHNLQKVKPKLAKQILDYKLHVYMCKGTVDEKLEWFHVINIGTMELTNQEMRNAFYTGEWLTDAKRIFSKSNGKGVRHNNGLVTGETNRQGLLEKVLLWKAQADGLKGKDNDETIRNYMSLHQHDNNADELWQYFYRVINWANMVFDGKWSIKKSQPWGEFYNEYHNNVYDSSFIHSEVERLLLDDEIQRNGKTGIIPYLLSGKEKYLNLRQFSPAQRLLLYQRQKGICNVCKKSFDIEEMEADHIRPWSDNGKTEIDNGQMLCRHCNREKSNK